MADTFDYPCPCCGYLVFNEPPGSYAICDFCFWEDDPVQGADPLFSGGANVSSLEAAQRNYASLGVKEERFRKYVRAPNSNDRRDPKWRPFDRDRDVRFRFNAEDPAINGGGVRLWNWESSESGPYYWRLAAGA